MKIIQWTLIVKTGFSLQTLGIYNTKREAVREMEARRQPKTTVVRVERSFIFQTTV